MRRTLLAASALGTLALAVPAGASGDYGCTPRWNLFNADLACSSQITVAPGNDTRVNLALLLWDEAGESGSFVQQPDKGWNLGYGDTFFDWRMFSNAMFTRPVEMEWDGKSYFGSRCVSLRGGDAAFAEAVAANRKLTPHERDLLLAARAGLANVCEIYGGGYWLRERAEGQDPEIAWPQEKLSQQGDEFLVYLTGAAAFYSEKWEVSREAFDRLGDAKDPWLRETASYMSARLELNVAQATVFDDWGFFDGVEAADQNATRRAQAKLARYVDDYPRGRYVASAKGLQRRALWLAHDLPGLSEQYALMLARAAKAPTSDQTLDLLNEVDNKLLLDSDAKDGISSPLLLATYDLMRMRGTKNDSLYDYGQPPIGLAELEGHEALMADHPGLYGFLRATYAFYVEDDAQAVLRLIPARTGKARYSALEFSRQILRGQALAKLGKPETETHWLAMQKGAMAPYQRPTVDLALGLALEKAGRLEEAVGPGTPIQSTSVRSILLYYNAGPELLRAAFADHSRPAAERDLALFTLLYGNLSRGRYDQFLSDLPLVPADADGMGSLWEIEFADDVPVGLFTGGQASDGYACPALSNTVRTLASKPSDAKSLLCLGDFYRLNGFDDYLAHKREPGSDELGGGPSYFSGTSVPRSAFYTQIIKDSSAARGDRAYALYRAIRCYAPTGYSTCGGEDVPESQRQAWFRTLKRQYADTRWARDLEYYW